MCGWADAWRAPTSPSRRSTIRKARACGRSGGLRPPSAIGDRRFST